MADANAVETVFRQSSLGDVVLQAQDASSALTDRWLGKRFDARTALAIPVWVRFPTEGGHGPPVQAAIRDVSVSGIGILADRAMRTDDVVLVRFNINSTCWSGLMRVRHCTQTTRGYKVGLEALEEAAGPPERKASPLGRLLAEPTSPGELRPASLARIKAEARKVAQAYHLARFSWGPLGTAIRSQICRIIDGLSPPKQYEPADGRRKQGRTLVDTGTSIVFRLPHGWRQVPARIVDVSPEGIGLLLPTELVGDPAEREMTGELGARVGMTLIVGLGCEPQRLWIPGEVMNCAEAKDGRVRAGIQFATPASQKMFNT